VSGRLFHKTQPAWYHIPGLDIVSIAKGYGCDTARLDDLEEIKKAAVQAWSKPKPTVLEVPMSRK
jgi:benzoylformate decarboxylase